MSTAKQHPITLLALVALCALAALVMPRPAGAAISLESFAGGVRDAEGLPFKQAGGHPYEIVTEFRFDSLPNGKPVEDAKDVHVSLPPGMIGIPPSIPTCSSDLSTQFSYLGNERAPICPPESQVGSAEVELAGELLPWKFPIYNLEPPPGVPARFGFTALTPDIVLDGFVRPDDYGVDIISRSTSQGLSLNWVRVSMWGVPSDPGHNPLRACAEGDEVLGCGPTTPPAPFLSLPMDCSAGPQKTTIRVNSWQTPGTYATASFDHDVVAGNSPMTVEGCDLLGYDPAITIQPTSGAARSASGLQVDIEMPQNTNPEGQDTAYVKKTVVTLPEGLTVNPSAAEGLGACTPSQYAAESVDAAPGVGCPANARIGSVEIETPALDRNLTGSLYQAQQDDPATGTPGAENPFDTLLGLYIVAESKERGVTVKLAGKVEPDPATGRLVTTFDNLPQLPFDRFSLRFREGSRAVLATPPACGTYSALTEFTPWSAQDPDNPLPSEVTKRVSTFAVTSGPGGGPCPPVAGSTPFSPGFQAGTSSPVAAQHSPFSLRIQREDGMQELSRFSAQLPEGLLAKLAGVPECSEAGIAAARTKSGRAELAGPSCPAATQIGNLLGGAGVGSVLTYVPGKLYLAGPTGGAPLSVVAITPAVAGPFDLGTVVVRVALRVDPATAKVTVDGSASDPIPRLIKGVPLELRDLRVSVDRPGFMLNPTSCDPMAIGSTIAGGWGAVATPSSSFQAASCERLAFKPKLTLSLKGKTKRSGHPALTAVLTQPTNGQANIDRVSVVLPRAQFIDQGRIGEVCTRAQFAQSACPKNSVLGKATAFTPLLDEPLRGTVYLRANGGERELPDMVAALRGRIDVDLVGYIDAVVNKKAETSRIRNTFAIVPDAPVSKFVLKLNAGKKALLENSQNLCKSPQRATVKMDAQNGKVFDFNPRVKNACGKKAKKRRS